MLVVHPSSLPPRQARVRFWAGARQARGVDSETTTARTVHELRHILAADPAFARLADAVTFLIDGTAGKDDTVIPNGAVIDVMPPFAGG